jgi:GntR family transcriptional regulator, transcriptional repressor for pyruvate dehydrogenase complex
MSKRSSSPAAVNRDPADYAEARPQRRYQKMSEVIADELRARIAQGELSDGDLLPNEQQLQEQFGVSRPTLREAMRILEAEGLIITPRGGTKGSRITLPTADHAAKYAGLILQVRGATVADIFALRTLVEPAAARLAAERKDRPDVEPLRRIVDLMGAERSNPRELARLLQAFDHTLVSMSDNEALKLVGQMMTHILRLHLHTIPETVEELPAANVQGIKRGPALLHEVVEAIEAGNGPLAEQLMRARTLQNEDWHRRRMAERLSVMR